MSNPDRSNKLHQTPIGLPALVSVAQIADETGLSAKTIRRRIADGTLPAHRLGPRCIRVERDAVLELLQPIGGVAPQCGAAAAR
jgi:excisionase family DNA binding protein